MSDPVIPANPAAVSAPVSPATPTDALDAAKAIVASLKGLDKTQQERAIRYASETLNLAPPVNAPAPQHQLTPPLEHQAANPAHSPLPAKRLDIKQFTESKAPKSDNQFAAVVAYYYRFEAPPEQRCDTINDKTVRDAARLVVRKRPSRMVLNNAKNRGYLDSAGDGEFKINTVGENLVAVTLPGNGEISRKKAARTKAKTKKARTK